jgi:hypothetical protein
MPAAESLAYFLLSAAAAFVAYSLGRLHERRRSANEKQQISAADVYLGSQIELKRIQFEVKRSRSNHEFNNLLQRLRRFFDENFELRDLYSVNTVFCKDWLDKLVGVSWNDATKLRFREDVERLRAE